MGKLEEAFRLYKISLQKSQNIHSYSDESTCLGNLGLIYYSKKQFSRAISLFKKQIERLSLLGDKGGLARTLGNLGACYLCINKYQKAQSLFFLQSSKLEGLGKRYSEAICLANIAIVNSLQGDFAKSSFYIQKQIKIAGKILNQEGLFRAYTNLGINNLNQHDLNTAIKNFSKAIRIADRNKLMLNLELTQLYYAETLYQLSRFSDAIRYSLLASSNAKRTNNKLILINSECIYLKSKICTELGISSNVTSTAIVAVPEFLNKMKYLLYSCTKPEEKAVVCYEVFVVIKVCRKYKVEVPDTLSYIKRAINYYSKILHKYESFKSLLRLKELKNELLKLRRKNETQKC
jgi:tetratricopeptide (TPR) repeat protein